MQAFRLMLEASQGHGEYMNCSFMLSLLSVSSITYIEAAATAEPYVIRFHSYPTVSEHMFIYYRHGWSQGLVTTKVWIV